MDVTQTYPTFPFRVIMHLDFDCFYAQIHMRDDPALMHVPVGVKQKTILATTSYLARHRGVRKMDSITNALKICPSMKIFNGEVLEAYRTESDRVFEFMKYLFPHCPVQRLGFDEVFVDVTRVVRATLQSKVTAPHLSQLHDAAHREQVGPDPSLMQPDTAASAVSGGKRVPSSTSHRTATKLHKTKVDVHARTPTANQQPPTTKRSKYAEDGGIDPATRELSDILGYSLPPEYSTLWTSFTSVKADFNIARDLSSYQQACKPCRDCAVPCQNPSCSELTLRIARSKEPIPALCLSATHCSTSEHTAPPSSSLADPVLSLNASKRSCLWVGHVQGAELLTRSTSAPDGTEHCDMDASVDQGQDVERDWLALGSLICYLTRKAVFNKFNLTTCGGVSNSMLLAKVAGELHKPNQQCCLLPELGASVIASRSLSKIPGMGRALRRKLKQMDIYTVSQLLLKSVEQLTSSGLSAKEAQQSYQLARGIDSTAVAMTGLPKSMSNEDNLGKCTSTATLVSRLFPIIERLLRRVKEHRALHARTPRTFRFSICTSGYRSRLARQVPLAPSLLEKPLSEQCDALVSTCLGLLKTMVQGKWSVGVINVAVTNFQTPGGCDLARFFSPSNTKSPQIATSGVSATSASRASPTSSAFLLRDVDCAYDDQRVSACEMSHCARHGLQFGQSNTPVEIDEDTEDEVDDPAAFGGGCRSSALDSVHNVNKTNDAYAVDDHERRGGDIPVHVTLTTPADQDETGMDDLFEGTSLSSDFGDEGASESFWICPECHVELPIYCTSAHRLFHTLGSEQHAVGDRPQYTEEIGASSDQPAQPSVATQTHTNHETEMSKQ
eukprot:m.243731 g.243731  ORF g.243731 m.243731 type:complete len:840 (+) comp15348_c0_seq11:230-2749(+)